MLFTFAFFPCVGFFSSSFCSCIIGFLSCFFFATEVSAPFRSTLSSSLPLFLTPSLPHSHSSSLLLFLTPSLPHSHSSSLPLFLTPTLPHSFSSSLPLFLPPTLPHSLSSSLPLFLTPSLPHSLSSSLPLFLTLREFQAWHWLRCSLTCEVE